MPNSKSIIAIIPARSGSKGLPDKNIRPLCGKPLIAYTIEAAIRSGIFSDIVVSTDSEIYAEIALKYGAQVPFLRPADLARDDSSTSDAVRYTLQKYQEMGRKFSTFGLLQPTSPLRTVDDILGAWRLFQAKKAGAVVSVCETDHPVAWMNTLDETLSLKNFIKQEYKNKRRQDLSVNYRLNGAIYIVDINHFKKNKEDIYTDGCYAYLMSRENSVDIDNILDFYFAETIIKYRNEQVIQSC